MKVLQYMKTALRRKSSPPSSQPGSPSADAANKEVASPSRKRRATLTMIMRKSSTGTCSTAEDSHRSLASSSEAPWRVERIRKTAPGEADWWKESTLDTTASTEDDTVQLSSSSGVSGESLDDSVAPEEGSGTSCSSSTSGPKVFHNCGLETWEAARAVWTAKPDDTSDGVPKRPSYTGRGAPPSRKDLAKILTKASSLRTYELPRRIPLTNLVDAYVSSWSGADEL